MHYVDKGIYEKNDDIVSDVLTVSDQNDNELFDFEEFLRIHIALKYGKVLVEKTGDETLRKYAAFYVAADTNFDQCIEREELINLYARLYAGKLNVEGLRQLLTEKDIDELDMEGFANICCQLDQML